MNTREACSVVCWGVYLEVSSHPPESSLTPTPAPTDLPWQRLSLHFVEFYVDGARQCVLRAHVS
jgi:hypothetical protein